MSDPDQSAEAEVVEVMARALYAEFMGEIENEWLALGDMQGIWRDQARAGLTTLQESGYVVARKGEVQTGVVFIAGRALRWGTRGHAVVFHDCLAFGSTEDRDAYLLTPEGKAWQARRDAERAASGPGYVVVRRPLAEALEQAACHLEIAAAVLDKAGRPAAASSARDDAKEARAALSASEPSGGSASNVQTGGVFITDRPTPVIPWGRNVVLNDCVTFERMEQFSAWLLTSDGRAWQDRRDAERRRSPST